MIVVLLNLKVANYIYGYIASRDCPGAQSNSHGLGASEDAGDAAAGTVDRRRAWDGARANFGHHNANPGSGCTI